MFATAAMENNLITSIVIVALLIAAGMALRMSRIS
jgi:hypothetical protein